MIFLLILALVSLSLATTAIVLYPLPIHIFSRAILFAWFIGVTVIIVLICWGIWAGSHAGS
jgi:hypothetical protein